MSDIRKDQELLHDSLAFYQSWLCGSGLTSPGVFVENEILVAELARLEALKNRTDAALALIRRSDEIRVTLARELPEGTLPGPVDLADGPIGEADLRRIRSALEAYIEEYGSLNLMVGAAYGRVAISLSDDPDEKPRLVDDL